MRWVTFYYSVLNDSVSDLKVHSNKEEALKYFNKHCKQYFPINSQFKVDKLPATYGYPLRKYCGISARAFKEQFDCTVDQALKWAEMESK